MKKTVFSMLSVCGLLLGGGVYGDTRTVVEFKSPRPSENYSTCALCAGKNVVNFTGSYTLSVWVKVNVSAMSATAVAPIMDQQADAQQVFKLDYNKGINMYRFAHRTSKWGFSESDYTRAEAPAADEWTFLTAVYDAENKMRYLYINGELAASNPDTSPLVVNPQEFRAGYVRWVDRFFGQMAEMSVWQGALSAEKIGAIMRARPSGDDLEGCVAYWPFDEETAGPSCRDCSAAGTSSLAIGDTTKIVLGTEVDDFPEFSMGDTRKFYSITVYPAADGSVDVEELTTPDQGVKYLEGATASFSATSATRRFVRWFGDVPETQISNTTVNLVVDKELRIAPYYAPNSWDYNAAAKQITDGYWTLNVSESAGQISVTGVASNPGKVRILDVSAPIDNGSRILTSFGELSFKGNLDLMELYLPETLTSIRGTWTGNAVFMDCKNLERVEPFLPSSLTLLGEYAFFGCEKLTGDLVLEPKGGTLTLGDGGIWGSEFFAKTGITSVKVGNGVSELPEGTFQNCKALTNVVLRGSVENVGTNCFSGCTMLRDVYFETKPEFGPNCFYDHPTYMRFHVMLNDDGWAEFLVDSEKVTPWAELSEAEKNVYLEAYPGERRPIAQVKSTAGFHRALWVLSWSPTEHSTLLLVK